MTMPCERTRAALAARNFLIRIASPYEGGIKGIRAEVRDEALMILRHFPMWFDLGRADAFDAETAMQIANAETPEEWGRSLVYEVAKPRRRRAK